MASSRTRARGAKGGSLIFHPGTALAGPELNRRPTAIKFVVDAAQVRARALLKALKTRPAEAIKALQAA